MSKDGNGDFTKFQNASTTSGNSTVRKVFTKQREEYIPAGVESALAVLKKMSRERNKNIYLISHKDELMGRVNSVLRVIKEGGFTSYSNSIDTV